MLRTYFFKILAVLGAIATTVAAIGDAAHCVATSRLIWSDVGSFLETFGLIEAGERFVLLNALGPYISNLLQAPLVVVLCLFTILSILLTARRDKL